MQTVIHEPGAQSLPKLHLGREADPGGGTAGGGKRKPAPKTAKKPAKKR